jgi:hypothetical protein
MQLPTTPWLYSYAARARHFWVHAQASMHAAAARALETPRRRARAAHLVELAAQRGQVALAQLQRGVRARGEALPLAALQAARRCRRGPHRARALARARQRCEQRVRQQRAGAQLVHARALAALAPRGRPGPGAAARGAAPSGLAGRPWRSGRRGRLRAGLRPRPCRRHFRRTRRRACPHSRLRGARTGCLSHADAACLPRLCCRGRSHSGLWARRKCLERSVWHSICHHGASALRCRCTRVCAADGRRAHGAARSRGGRRRRRGRRQRGQARFAAALLVAQLAHARVQPAQAPLGAAARGLPCSAAARAARARIAACVHTPSLQRHSQRHATCSLQKLGYCT